MRTTPALVLATLLALVPWAGLIADASSQQSGPPGTPTTAGCDTAWCFPSLDHVVLSSTIGPAAVSAGLAAAIAAVVLARSRARVWPTVVIAAAAAGMALYAILA